MPEPLAALSRLIGRVGLAVAGAGLLAMTLVIFWQVFARYVLNASPSWSEQAALLLMNWFVLIAAAVGVREGFHIQITAAVNTLGAPLKGGVRGLTHIIVCAIGVALAVYGVQLVTLTWSHNIPTLGLSRGAGYIPLPVSGVLIAFFSLEQLLADMKGEEVKSVWN